MKMGKDGNFVRKVEEQSNGDGNSTWSVRTRTGHLATLPGTRDPIAHRGTKVPAEQTQRDAHDMAEEINWS